jgi:glycosyltransferase involved in cell wall biosynthesis
VTLRVVVLDHTAQPSGAELALLRVVEAMDRGVQVHVVLFAPGPLVDRLRHAGATVEVVPLAARVGGRSRHELGPGSPGGLLRSLLTLLAAVPFELRLARRLRRLRPDVVHATSLKADLLGVLPAACARRPLVWHVHDRVADDYLPAPVVRVLRRGARHLPAAVVANSDATAATLPGARGLTVVRPGLAASQVRAAPRPEPADDVVGLVGRIGPTKGQLELVRAAPAVLAAHPGTRFRFVGAPLFGAEEYARQVRSEVDRLGLADAVEWTGFVDDVAAELDALTVCVHASPVPEPYGQVVAEALARGVPVVATRAGGVPEILERAGDDPVGVMVPPGDVEALARAVVDVLTDREAAGRRAAAGHARAVAELGVDRTVDGLVSVWRRVAGGRGSRP